MRWQPTASLGLLQRRAALLARAREFFARRGVMEVQTPALVNAAVTDAHIQCFEVPQSGAQGPGPPRYLHSSPEYAMKRLLAAGCGDIYQLCPVFRRGERSALHNPEFTLLEWYRLGFGLDELMAETTALIDLLLADARAARPAEHLSYREAFLRELSIDPLDADSAALEARLAGVAVECGLDPVTALSSSRDELLDLVLATRIGPALGRGALCCLHRYPASQAALARLDPDDPRVSLRFEVYADGIELANGFVELADAAEQRARFASDLALRRAQAARAQGTSRPVNERMDERLLDALASGLPPCAGVAVGFDRVLMIATGAKRIDEVMAFPIEHA